MATRPVRAVIFDCDGTLVDGEAGLQAGVAAGMQVFALMAPQQVPAALVSPVTPSLRGTKLLRKQGAPPAP